MSEHQKHGLLWEDEVINMYNLVKSDKYTSVWDAYTQDGVPVSIKTKMINTNVEMGDLFRNSRCNEDFFLVVGFWSGRKDNIVRVDKLFVDANFWKSQFDENIVNQFKNIFDGISNSKEDDQKWKSRMKDFKDLWNSQETIIQVHPKRDHKKQKRVQCSVKKKKWEEISNLFKVENIK